MKNFSDITRFLTIKLSDTKFGRKVFCFNVDVLHRSVEIPKHAFLAHIGTVGLQMQQCRATSQGQLFFSFFSGWTGQINIATIHSTQS